MPLQKLADQGSCLFGLIEHEVMTSVGNLSPLHAWAYFLNLLQEGWRQAWAMLSTEDQGWAGDTLPEQQGIH